MFRSKQIDLCCWLVLILFSRATYGAEPDAELVTALRVLPSNVLTAAERKSAMNMVPNDIGRRLTAANQKSTADWKQLHSRQDWQRYRDEKLQALRDSLHLPADLAAPPSIQVSRSVAGEGFTIDNIYFESRPHFLVTGNLYRPAKPLAKMPGILICHSHHHPKTEHELQTMGMTWARAGCLVLVIDQLGHGERRQHPFRTASDYPAPFKASRQDYFFRYDLALQLALTGESLMGWMVWDLRCAVDVLLSQPGIDAQRIILLGAVAGGGDPAAVAGALDSRIAAVVPFNFGGPQPETRYPLPDDAEDWFEYSGSGSWESTRNLAQSASGGFLPWVIVGSIAPRRLVYGHEFDWDRERDPVWKRLKQIYQWEEAPANLALTLGSGSVRGQGPEATHCNNIGAVHRKLIHAAWRRWFNIDLADDAEYDHPLPPEQLWALSPTIRVRLHPRSALDVALKSALERRDRLLQQLLSQVASERLKQLQESWKNKLGHIDPSREKGTFVAQPAVKVHAEIDMVRGVLQAEPGIDIPVLILTPVKDQPAPVVVGLSQDGKDRFLKESAVEIAELLSRGIAVCLPDVRGTGETALEDRSHGRSSDATAYSSSELMLGGTLLGARLRDLRNVIKYLRTDPRITGQRIAIWGDSFAAANPHELEYSVPQGIDNPATSIEPLGGLLAIFTALYEDDIRAVAVHHGLTSFTSVITGPRTYLPHDMLVPDAIGQGEITALLIGIAPTPLRMWHCRTGLNRPEFDDVLPPAYTQVIHAYRLANHLPRLQLGEQPQQPLSEWFAEHLQK